ncbi:MAG: hypothetical protein GTO63_09470 [Anaerolineae bacterium]|nr:hypothetical protein [Anaerolineae bacterium]NIN95113.1 hypothetical protein [Anaerolineae bacterium]NIQ78965.1 hypothetical protein [Anaerolineae bacterium]
MSENEPLRLLGSADVRNAVLLNEIGNLLHDLGKLSVEYVSAEQTFSHHLILRRLCRGRDPFLGLQADSSTTIRRSLGAASLGAVEKDFTQVVCGLIAELLDRTRVHYDASPSEVRSAITRARETLPSYDQDAFDRAAHLAEKVAADLAWQRAEEQFIGDMRSPFFSVEGFLEGLDELPFVADLIEMQGRTWHPEALLSPEVKLLRAIHEREEIGGHPQALINPERLADIRKLYCEVVAKHLLEINNIKKDGPGDLGSWFWKGRLYPRPEKTAGLLDSFDDGTALEGEHREAVERLGIRPITQWAYSKLLLGQGKNGGDVSLWDHSYRLSALHKSTMAKALIAGYWPEPAKLSWRTLRVVVERSDSEALTAIKYLVEVEYPLGNELWRSETGIHFTFPGLEGDLATRSLDRLRERTVQELSPKLRPQLSLSPLWREITDSLVGDGEG